MNVSLANRIWLLQKALRVQLDHLEDAIRLEDGPSQEKAIDKICELIEKYRQVNIIKFYIEDFNES